MPACFSMLLSVPIGISRTGCGTVTRPGFTGCLNCLWLPRCATSYQPSCCKRWMTSRLDIRHDTHFLHTCQVEFTGAPPRLQKINQVSVWVKWRLSPFDYSEITINDVLGEVSRALDEPPCEARGDLHGEKSLSHMSEMPTIPPCSGAPLSYYFVMPRPAPAITFC